MRLRPSVSDKSEARASPDGNEAPQRATEAPQQPDQPDVVVSRSRQDEPFVDSWLRPRSAPCGKDVWIETEDIQFAANWPERDRGGPGVRLHPESILTRLVELPLGAATGDRGRQAPFAVLIPMWLPVAVVLPGALPEERLVTRAASAEWPVASPSCLDGLSAG